MSELTAVDILIDPDETMLARARQENERMRASYPGGFALDEHHQPHITTLQRYVRTADLEQVLDAVQATIESVDMSKVRLTAKRLAHMDGGGGLGVTAIVVDPGPEVLDLQARLIEAIRPFTGSGGTADAYVRTEAEPEINDLTLEYIENYVPEHSGANFIAHVTVGLATLDDLSEIEAEPFDELTFGPAGMSVYQLGNNGTAARHIKSWTVAAP